MSPASCQQILWATRWRSSSLKAFRGRLLSATLLWQQQHWICESTPGFKYSIIPYKVSEWLCTVISSSPMLPGDQIHIIPVKPPPPYFPRRLLYYRYQNFTIRIAIIGFIMFSRDCSSSSLLSSAQIWHNPSCRGYGVWAMMSQISEKSRISSIFSPTGWQVWYSDRLTGMIPVCFFVTCCMEYFQCLLFPYAICYQGILTLLRNFFAVIFTFSESTHFCQFMWNSANRDDSFLLCKRPLTIVHSRIFWIDYSFSQRSLLLSGLLRFINATCPIWNDSGGTQRGKRYPIADRHKQVCLHWARWEWRWAFVPTGTSAMRSVLLLKGRLHIRQGKGNVMP